MKSINKNNDIQRNSEVSVEQMSMYKCTKYQIPAGPQQELLYSYSHSCLRNMYSACNSCCERLRDEKSSACLVEEIKGREKKMIYL